MRVRVIVKSEHALIVACRAAYRGVVQVERYARVCGVEANCPVVIIVYRYMRVCVVEELDNIDVIAAAAVVKRGYVGLARHSPVVAGEIAVLCVRVISLVEVYQGHHVYRHLAPVVNRAVHVGLGRSERS